MNNNNNYTILSNREEDYFSQKTAEKLKKELGRIEFIRFAVGETNNRINTNLRRSDIYLIVTFKENINSELFEALQIIHNIKLSHCRNLTVICPDLPYSRQDKRHDLREPNSAKLLADLLKTAGADHVITLELHSSQIEGYHKSLDHLRTESIFSHYFNNIYKNEDFVVLAPDAGGMRKANSFAREMSLKPEKPLDIAFVQKERVKTNIAESGKIVGDVKNKTVVICDDMVDTGGTLMQAAKIAKQAGASKIFACCTHAYMNSKPDAEKDFDQLLFESDIDELVVTNTRPFILDRIKNSEKLRKKVTLLDISPCIAEAVRRDQQGYTIIEMLKETDKSKLYEVLFKRE